MDQRSPAATTGPATPYGAPVPAPVFPRLALALSALLALRLLALALNRADLFFDEAQYWAWAQAPAFGYYSKPPLIAWLIAASTSLCGNSEFCIRLPSPLIHTATALTIAALGARLYDARTGALAALAFALLPGVSLSAGIISTDVPLLLCWALALLGFAALFETKAWWPALLLSAALAAGLNAKYAMAWFILCAAIYLIATPARRTILRDPRLWAAVALGIAGIVPNLIWNQAHSFATFAHTADNAKWEGGLLHPAKALEFFASQFGVFGPFYFAGLLLITYRGLKLRFFTLPLVGRAGVGVGLSNVGLRDSHPNPPRVAAEPRSARTGEGKDKNSTRETAGNGSNSDPFARHSEPDRLLMAFCLPLILIITGQAFLSRAHPNWAAVAYVSGTLLVVATLVRELAWGWLKASYALHAALLAALIAATSLAGALKLPLKPDPLARTLGWRALAEATRAELDAARARGTPYAAVMTDKRAVTAELLYYMRAEPTPVLAFRAGPRPHDHFELSRPYTPASGEPVLLVSLAGVTDDTANAAVPSAASAFAQAHVVAGRDIPAGKNATRRVTFLALSGYKGP